MAKWRLSFLFIAGSIYGVNRFVLNMWQLDSYIIPYLNDILCLPIVLTIAFFFQQQIIYKNTSYRLNKFQVIFTVCYFALVFEVILPWYSSRYVSDIWDVVAYAVGGLFYYLVLNPAPVLNKVSSKK